MQISDSRYNALGPRLSPGQRQRPGAPRETLTRYRSHPETGMTVAPVGHDSESETRRRSVSREPPGLCLVNFYPSGFLRVTPGGTQEDK